jgi:hypothetical protein
MVRHATWRRSLDVNFSIFSIEAVLVGLSVLGACKIARAETLASSDFSSDPGGGPRFVHNGDGTLTAKIDTALPTALLIYSFAPGKTLTQNDSFVVTAKLKIENLFADPNGYAQFSFGLMNSVTTGTDRSGGIGGTSEGDALDVFSFDYFPNITFFGGPSALNSIITSSNPPTQTTVFANTVATFSPETEMDNAGETPLPTGQFLTVTYTFTGATGETVLKILDAGGTPIEINKIGDGNLPGGFDGDPTTIQTFLPSGRVFTTDSFALMNWTDSWGAYDFGSGTFNPTSVSADVTYDSFSVETLPAAVPEPASISLLGLSIVSLIARKRHQQR